MVDCGSWTNTAARVCLDHPAEQRLAQANTLRKLKLTRCDPPTTTIFCFSLHGPPAWTGAGRGGRWEGVGGVSASLHILWGTPAGRRLTGSGTTNCVCCSSSRVTAPASIPTFPLDPVGRKFIHIALHALSVCLFAGNCSQSSNYCKPVTNLSCGKKKNLSLY